MARFEIEHYGRVLRLPPERFVAVPNGSDLPELLPGERHPPDPGLIASVGRLERFKGHHRAIAALPEVARRRPDVRLWIAGSGPYGPKLRRLAARLGVSDRVEIEAVPPDRRREMAERLSRASLVVLLSEFETHPIAVLEAAALGRPVLVGDTSGLRELAQDGLARAIPLDASPERLAGAMIEEMQRPPLVRSPAIHTWDECAERLLGVYREVLGRAA